MIRRVLLLLFAVGGGFLWAVLSPRAADTLRSALASRDLAELGRLVASRKAAAAELKQSPEIRKEIDSFVEDAEKYLKGAEKYLAQSVKDTKSGRSNEEKQTMWTRVVDKIEKRFEERIGQTEAVVNGWYEKVLNAEVAEVRSNVFP